jgi:flagellar FliL protein
LGSKLPLILQLVNLVAFVATLGYMVQTKLLYKRPAITESGEKERILAELKKEATEPAVPAFIKFDPVTINIHSASRAEPGSGKRGGDGKLHYATVGFSLEVRDEEEKGSVESAKPLILDQLGILLGKRPFHELATVQGRYILASDLVSAVNKVLNEHSDYEEPEVWVTNVYFTEFVVQ